MIPTCDIKVILRSDAVQVALIMGAVMRRGNGIPLLRCWPRLPPSAVIALQFQPAPVFFCPILSGKTSRPLPAPSQRYNTLDFASKVVCQGDAVPVGFPATKPPVSLDSSGQGSAAPFGFSRQQGCSAPLLDNPAPKDGHRPPLESTPKAKKECAKFEAHSFLLSEM